MSEEKVKLILSEKKKIRGKEYPAGTPMFEGFCIGDFKTADVEKAIQLHELMIDPKALNGTPKPAAKAKKVEG